MFVRSSIAEYENRLLKRFFPVGELEALEPSCARKLVEDAVRYAAALGFQPHPDGRKACRVFGGIDPGVCTRQFVFGYEGKPHYIQGPHDSPQRVARILDTLKSRCGEGNFTYLVVADDLSDLPDLF
jgi:hypothetical protein